MGLFTTKGYDADEFDEDGENTALMTMNDTYINEDGETVPKQYREYTNEELRAVARAMYQEHILNTSKNIHKDVQSRNVDKLVNVREGLLTSIQERLLSRPLSDGYCLTGEQIQTVLSLITSIVWGYDVLDPLIQDDTVSDIKVYSADNIRVKRYGHRMDSGVHFESDADCESFIRRILERNGINLGISNANQTFTDSSQDKAILRISIVSELLCDNKKPCMAIRKIPKHKQGLAALDKAGMFDHIRHKQKRVAELKQMSVGVENPALRDLIPKFIMSRGLLFTGKGASGKTTLMNALIDLIPKEDSVMICQENSELFVDEKTHPDVLCTHVDINGGDSKVSYTLGDLTRMGLLIDLDRIIVGEVKQADEAAGLSKASMTGHKCWTSVHGENCDMAINKMADYISQANRNYSFENCLSQIQGFEYVIHLRNFQIDEVVHIIGWDHETQTLQTETVYKI